MFGNVHILSGKIKYRHILLLLYWPVYLLAFYLIEQFISPKGYFAVHSFLDDLIPFHEAFLIPYFLWHALTAALLIYTMLREVQIFRKLMWYIIITYTMAVVIYIVFPTCQELRPEVFTRDNILTQATALLYSIDTNTNVCPSTHVIGAIGMAFAACRCNRFSSTLWKAVIWFIALLICASTVFLKQHSIVDFFVALPVCALGYFLCFRRNNTDKLLQH